MLKEIIDEVSKLSGKADGRIAVFADKRYAPVEFSEANYHEIGLGFGKTLAFVDGGNAELIKAPGLSLQLMRNAAAVMKGNRLLRSRKREFYLLAKATDKGTAGKIFSEGNIDDVQDSAELAKFCDSIRKASEVKFAIEMLSEADIIIMDGTFEAQNEIEKRHLDELRFETITRSKTAAAVAKTTTIMTDQGNSFAAMLAKKREGSWHYNPVAEIKSDHHKAEMFFARLNNSSSHVFRAEVFREQKSEIAMVAAELKENSRDLAFPGYPHGLVIADKLARIGEREAEYLKAKMFAAAGSKWSSLKSDLSALNAHEILDSM